MRNKFLGTGEPGWHPVRKVRVVLSGLRFAVLYDGSVAWKVVVSTVVLAVFGVTGHWRDFLLMLVATGQMLAAELLNSAVEAAIDRFGGELHPLSKRAKDLGSAAVLLSLLIAAGARQTIANGSFLVPLMAHVYVYSPSGAVRDGASSSGI